MVIELGFVSHTQHMYIHTYIHTYSHTYIHILAGWGLCVCVSRYDFFVLVITFSVCVFVFFNAAQSMNVPISPRQLSNYNPTGVIGHKIDHRSIELANFILPPFIPCLWVVHVTCDFWL